VDDAAKAPQPQFSGQHVELCARLDRAVAELCAGSDATVVLEALQDEAETPDQLAAAYARLLRERDLDAVPRVARLELCLQAAWCCSQLDEHDATTLQAATLALELAPADERALALAEPLLLEAERYSELSNLYAVAATSAGNESRARQLLERAIHMLAPFPAATPAVLGLTERLQRLPTLRDGDDALLAIAESGSAAERSAAIVKLGERWLGAGNARDGVSKLRIDLATVDSDAVLDVLERLFDQVEDAPRLQATLLRRAEIEPTSVGRARALEKLARFYLEIQQDEPRAGKAFSDAAEAYAGEDETDDAQRCYEKLLELAPDDVRAASQLSRLRGAVGDFAGVAEAFSVVLRASDDNRAATELLLSLASDAERAGAAEEFAELADSVLWRLPDTDREMAARLLRQSAHLFVLGTRYDEAAELYRRLIADEATSEDLDAYQALIDAHPSGEWRRNQQRWLFEWQEHHTSDRPTLLLSWARFEEQELGDPEAAIDVLSRAAELAPDRAEIWENLTRLRLSEGDGAGGLLAAGELRRLGRELDDGLLHLLLEQEPTARWALDRVKLTLSAEQRWPELFALYERAIDATPEERARAELLDEAAIAARDVAQDRARALSYWEQHAALMPGEPRVDLALDRLYEQSGDRAGLIAHTRRRLGQASPESRPALLRRIAKLSLDEGALSEALEAAELLSADDPTEAERLLEQVLARCLELANDRAVQSSGRRAAQILRKRQEQAENPQERARLLRAELRLVCELDDRRALLSELSRLCERELSDVDAAFEVERELFVLTRSEKDRKRLDKLAKKAGRHAELCETYADAAALLEPLGERQGMLRRAADVARERLRDRPLTLQLFRRLFEQDAAHATETYRTLREELPDVTEAFDALCWLLEESQRFEELAQTLIEAAERSPAPELLKRLGRLQADRLGMPAKAVATHLSASDSHAAAEVFLRAPSVFGEDPATVLELSRRLVSAGEPEGALRVLRHQLGFYEQRNSTQRKLVQLELVSVLELTGASEEAASELDDAAKRFPADAEVQRACAASAASRYDWDRAEQCYRALLLLLHGSGAEPELRRASVYVALAAIKRRRGQEPEAAELLESAFEAALGNAAELSALTQSLLDDQQWQAAERASLELLELARDLPTAAKVLGAISQLVAHRPSVELLTRARQLAERLLTNEAEQLSPEDRLGAELALCGALLASEVVADRDDACLRLERLVKHADVPVAAWALLARAAERRADPDKLSFALSAWLEREPANAEVLSRSLGAALKRGEVDAALDYADRLQRSGRTVDAETTSELRKLCVRSGKTERAVSLLTQEAEHERQAPKRAALLIEAAELQLAAGQTQAALENAARARQLDAASADAVLLIAKVALEQGRRGEALDLLTSHAESRERRRGKPLAKLLRLAADLRLERDEPAEALALLQEAHQLDKTDLDTALLVGLVAVDLDRLDTAASALRVLIAQRELGTREGTAARSLNLARGYFQLARIEHHHGKKTNAKRMALRALEEDPSLVPAQRLMRELGAS
jgi:tetratricopeptide (TPR) repeat protein